MRWRLRRAPRADLDAITEDADRRVAQSTAAVKAADAASARHARKLAALADDSSRLEAQNRIGALVRDTFTV